MSYWIAIHAPAEGEPCPLTDYPWYPSLYIGGGDAGLDIWFQTEAECLEFIRNVVLPAALEGDAGCAPTDK